ncbi:MAG: NlpC/P60 family protein [Candidatus Pacebacteria bacterium]|nr:NlpC/P60 family protein [Candidatus Paceibacterota bacterium]MCD8507822.1 NlpC/P60 family protein [Candidatus Paceibacterota bacterium]MCD8528030.1 NlpC/P60 family protein [Candidatus Paceibacterota bacterium]MCD8563888.1 NlpC/P60 family protein [Candidatus Paceibacterota bacterium]
MFSFLRHSFLKLIIVSVFFLGSAFSAYAATSIANLSLDSSARQPTSIRVRTTFNVPSVENQVVEYTVARASAPQTPLADQRPSTLLGVGRNSHTQVFLNLNPDTEYIITASLYNRDPANPANQTLVSQRPLTTSTGAAVTDGQAHCIVTRVSADVSGSRSSGFWNINQKPQITFNIDGTPGCHNKSIVLNVVQRNTIRDRGFALNLLSGLSGAVWLDLLVNGPEFLKERGAGGSLENRNYFFDTNNKLSITFKMGDQNCKRPANQEASSGVFSSLFTNDCDYTLEITDDSGVFYTHNAPNPNNRWSIAYDACTSQGALTETAIIDPCAEEWELVQIQPPQSTGGIAVDGALLRTFDEECLDDLGQPIEGCYALLAPLPGISRVTADTTIGEYLNIVIRIVIGMLGLLAVIMIVVGGIQYMSTDAISGKSEGRERITKAVLGLILALGSFIILTAINPDLTRLDPNMRSTSIQFDSAALRSPNFETGGDRALTPSEQAAAGPLKSLPSGVYCPIQDASNNAQGAGTVNQIARSFVNQATYSMGGKNASNQSCVPGPMCLDCSGFANYVLYCAGMLPGITDDSQFRVHVYNTGTLGMFSGQDSRRIENLYNEQGDWFVDLQGSTAPVALRPGDLLGWISGDGGERNGHVVVYIGNGKTAESTSGDNGRTSNSIKIRDVNSYGVRGVDQGGRLTRFRRYQN